ncbi:MAG TPA: LppP/LprE family lipoprotein [Solirubrobacteraceae bacterium]|nr:LppP/LprE family lipoprotein [Solirubrobacteraceae bacterium]
MIRRAGAIACVLTGAALLLGCGGGTQTVSVANGPAVGGAGAPSTAHTAPSPASTSPTVTSGTSSGTSGAPTGTSGGTAAQGAAEQGTSTTRTAPAPAFVHTTTQSGEAAGGEAGKAAAVMIAQGYTPVSLSTYRPTQTLRVLIGTRDRSTAGYNQRAFFFLDGRYLGNDSSQPSASVQVVSQSDTEVTLAYALYRPGDHECCPSGGQATVRFQLDDGQLTPLDPIPSASSSAPLSRQ